ncbi:hypothetical protein ACJMQP_25060 [Rhodopseudomonas palustris]
MSSILQESNVASGDRPLLAAPILDHASSSEPMSLASSAVGLAAMLSLAAFRLAALPAGVTRPAR